MRKTNYSVLFSKRECHFHREIIGKISCIPSDFMLIYSVLLIKKNTDWCHC